MSNRDSEEDECSETAHTDIEGIEKLIEGLKDAANDRFVRPEQDFEF